MLSPDPANPGKERQVPAHLFQAVTCGRKWLPQTSNLDSPPPTENRGKSAPAQPSQIQGWQTLFPLSSEQQPRFLGPQHLFPLHRSPCGFVGGSSAVSPSPFAACVLACLLSRNSKVGSQGLSCVLASAFSIQLLREALTGYISWFHFLPFLLWRAARKLFLVGFLDLGMALLPQNRRVGIYFTLLLNWKKPS